MLSLGQAVAQLAAITAPKASGQRNVWVAELKDAGGAGTGQYAGISLFDDAASATGKQLRITVGADTTNTITVNNVNLSQAFDANGTGYLGLKLDATQRIALVQGTGKDVGAATANVYADPNFTDAQVTGKASNLREANGKSFSIYLAQAANAGDTVTLALQGALAGQVKAKISAANGANRRNSTTIDANRGHCQPRTAYKTQTLVNCP